METAALIIEIDENLVTKDGADDRRTDESLTEANRPKDSGEVEPKNEMKDS